MKFLLFALVIFSFTCSSADIGMGDNGYKISSRISINDDKSEFVYFSSAFSHDDKYFAIALAKREAENDFLINVYESSTGEIKYHTKVINAEISNGHKLTFSKNNEMIVFYGLIATHQYLWKFKDSRNVIKACNGHMGGGIESISEDNNTILYRTFGDSRGSLCKYDVTIKPLSFEEIDSAIVAATGRGQIHTYRKILHKNKLIIPFSYSDNSTREEVKLPNYIANDIELWDIGYLLSHREVGDDLGFSMLDIENEIIILYESRENKTIIHQWSYADKTRLPSFELDFCISYFSNYMITLHYLFLETCDGGAALLEREGNVFVKKWMSKNFRSTRRLGKGQLIPLMPKKSIQPSSTLASCTNDTQNLSYCLNSAVTFPLKHH